MNTPPLRGINPAQFGWLLQGKAARETVKGPVPYILPLVSLIDHDPLEYEVVRRHREMARWMALERLRTLAQSKGGKRR